MAFESLGTRLRKVGMALIEQEEARARRSLEFAGPSPSPTGFMLERAELESVGSDGLPHARADNAIPCRDDSWIWRQTGRDFAPDYSARFEALLSEVEKRVLTLGAQMSAADAAAAMGLTPVEWQRAVWRIQKRFQLKRRK